MGIRPYFHTHSNKIEETYIQNIVLDYGKVIEIDFMEISYYRFSYDS